ncbi:bifunctional diaminohydroxyphosphoribosylaminopyrimidine deaminase/5-amino-6-(5-phosphoribosylamino)uracil reductase RibD [Peptoniphilus sp.]|jgi:diaminohydroxyphosphoribosylaminopyrimidine deaminase/5-amino-6-(5-phosphoribosylamino)uracil reductase|uniref:bifunctional diaminohydroxyphosphoribosylaminopyrimidine deaminase/5-amino-6-(5-phosphoribosylamino)uracil reductase RibD n=1 Tax=Peptoniphilus sp. TaxID=1971214 RepID=UPI003D89F783
MYFSYDDDYYMQKAIDLAKKGMGYTMANPLVGCVIVKDDKIIGEGYHEKFGKSHAEVNAINDAKSRGEDLEGATLYVNLEPCSHYGKTPPCANRIVEEKIKRVVIGTEDPFEKVAGRGVKILRDAGIEVEEYVMEDECLNLNERFFAYIENKRPFVVLKSAMSLDGKIATKTGESKWITSEMSRNLSHELRGKLDAIMVGINTVIADDPSLNVRHGNFRHDPIRVVVDSKLRIPLDRKILSEELPSFTIIATTKNYDEEKFETLSSKENVKIIVAEEKDGQVDLKDLLEKLMEFNISSILLEGGGILNASMLKENLVDKFYLFLAPKIIGSDGRSAIASMDIKSLKDAVEIEITKVEKLSGDILITGRI